MTVENMKEFVVLAEERNYLVAADILYTTQATLSRHIIAMEEELGFALFNRSTKRIELTAEGNRFLLYARNAIRIQDACRTALEQVRTENSGVLKVGYDPLVTFYHFSDYLTQFMSEHGDCEIKISQSDSAELLNAVRSGALEIAFIQENPFDKPRDIDFSRFYTDVMVAVLPSGHRLANRKSIEIDSLRNDRFIFSNIKSEPAAIALEACRRYGFSPVIERSGIVGHAMYDWVAASGCVALDWKVPALTHSDSRLALVELSPPLYSNSLLVYKKDNLSYDGRRLISFFESKSTALEMIEP